MEILKSYRAQIDDLDDRIVDLLKQRFDIIHQVAVIKKQNNIDAVLEDRVREVIDRASARGALHHQEIRELYTMLVAISCDLEEKLMGEHKELV